STTAVSSRKARRNRSSATRKKNAPKPFSTPSSTDRSGGSRSEIASPVQKARGLPIAPGPSTVGGNRRHHRPAPGPVPAQDQSGATQNTVITPGGPGCASHGTEINRA